MATRDPDRRRKIIDAARYLFARHGYEGASISMIASETGLTKAALYHHFPNKEAIFRACSRVGIDELIHEAETALHKAESHPVERLRAFMHATAARFEKKQDSWAMGAAIFWGTQSPTPRTEVVQRRDHYEELLKSILRTGIESGHFRSGLDVNLTSKFLMSVINQMPRWYSKGGKYDAVTIVDIFLTTYLDGMLARPDTPGI